MPQVKTVMGCVACEVIVMVNVGISESSVRLHTSGDSAKSSEMLGGGRFLGPLFEED